MNRQTHELALLGVLAACGGLLAWVHEDQMFTPVFMAQTTMAFLGLVRRLI